jgi:hypothetical protein
LQEHEKESRHAGATSGAALNRRIERTAPGDAQSLLRLQQTVGNAVIQRYLVHSTAPERSLSDAARRAIVGAWRHNPGFNDLGTAIRSGSAELWTPFFEGRRNQLAPALALEIETISGLDNVRSQDLSVDQHHDGQQDRGAESSWVVSGRATSPELGDIRMDKAKRWLNTNRDRYEAREYHQQRLDFDRLTGEGFRLTRPSSGVDTALFRCMKIDEFNAFIGSGTVDMSDSAAYKGLSPAREYSAQSIFGTHVIEFIPAREIDLNEMWTYLGVGAKIEASIKGKPEISTASHGLGAAAQFAPWVNLHVKKKDPFIKKGAAGDYFNEYLRARLIHWRLVECHIRCP